MSRRRRNPPAQQTRPQRNTRAERPVLTIDIAFLPDGKLEVEPRYNNALIEQLDVICRDTEEYDVAWHDDHKIAYYVWTVMDGFLAQWDPPVAQEEVDGAIPEVPHLNEVPVVDRLDIADMEIVK